MSWKTFLASHAEAIACADFLTVEVLTRAGLVRYLVFFVMRLHSRNVHIAGIAPADGWLSMNRSRAISPIATMDSSAAPDI